MPLLPQYTLQLEKKVVLTSFFALASSSAATRSSSAAKAASSSAIFTLAFFKVRGGHRGLWGLFTQENSLLFGDYC